MVYRKLTYNSPPHTPSLAPIPPLAPIPALDLNTPHYWSPSASTALPLDPQTPLMIPAPALTLTPGLLSWVEYY